MIILILKIISILFGVIFIMFLPQIILPLRAYFLAGIEEYINIKSFNPNTKISIKQLHQKIKLNWDFTFLCDLDNIATFPIIGHFVIIFFIFYDLFKLIKIFFKFIESILHIWKFILFVFNSILKYIIIVIKYLFYPITFSIKYLISKINYYINIVLNYKFL